MTVRIILDTDIGTDVDDCLALAVLLGSPELSLEAVTCVYGDVGLRARMVRKLLRLAGRDAVPVYVGAERPLLGKRTVYWEGHEGEGLLEPGDETLAYESEHAVDAIIRQARAHPGQLHLLAIGPLTNVALAFLREPRLPSLLAGLTIMGGVVRGPSTLALPPVEHNLACDPEAAHVVFAAGASPVVVPLDVTTRVVIRRDDVARLRARATPFHNAIADQVERYPRFARQGTTQLHDPLAVATLIDDRLVGLTETHLEVETRGELTAGMTVARAPSERAPANARIALDVDVAAAERLVGERLAG